jgi:hypothetical protein
MLQEKVGEGGIVINRSTERMKPNDVECIHNVYITHGIFTVK